MIENEHGLLAVVHLDATDKWERLLEIAPEHLTPLGLGALKRLLEATVHTVLVEKHYIDRDYRNTFSGFHSKKFVTPDSRTVRLHFFRGPVTSAQITDGSLVPGDYIGYSVIRPTRPNCLGRTLLDPARIKGVQGTVCMCAEKVSIQGTELEVSGFPFISQDVDATVCAQSAIWMVLRYFSNRFRAYREMHPFDITIATQQHSRGERVYPASGLHLWQMTETLRQSGFSPLTYSRNGYDGRFEELLYTYIESGFPVFTTFDGHVVVALGHDSDYARPIPKGTTRIKSTFFNRGFIINDDNTFPYQRLEPPPEPPPDESVAPARNPMVAEWNLSEVEAFAVPLPEKVFLAAEEFDTLVQPILDGHYFGIEARSEILKASPTLLTRQFLTTCRSFKRSLRIRGMGSKVVRDAYLDLPLPHFIWVCELTTPDLYRPGEQKVWGEIIWDATRNAYEHFGLIAVHLPEHLWIDLGTALNQARDPKQYTITAPEPYLLHRSNLREL